MSRKSYSPLPFINGKALLRVKDPLPKPTECPYCAGVVELIENSRKYGRSYGAWPYMYACSECDAYVGLHPQTDIPLGTLADQPLREARKESKRVFFNWIAKEGIPRGKAYSRLAKMMGIETKHCHFGHFDEAACAKAIRVLGG